MSKKICQIVTVSMTVDQFLRFAFNALNQDGFEVHLICNMNEEYIKTLPDYIIAHPIKMERGISLSGIKAVITMYKIFKKENFDIVQYSTPNASFYASIASFLARVPVRLYCQWGLVFVSFAGIKKLIFKSIERLACKLSTDIQPDSFGNLELCRKLGFYGEKKSRVVWNGSANGVDLTKFDIDKKVSYRTQIRQQYEIQDQAIVLGFLGRLMKDKGFNELIGAFKILEKKYNNLKLIFVGPSESKGDEDKELINYFHGNNNIIKTGNVKDPERYLSAMDVFVFPSYREGFGSAVIEAEAMGLPIIVTDIPGPTDAIEKGKTGFVVEVKNTNDLVEAIELLLVDENKRKECGEASVRLVKDKFDQSILLNKIIENRNWLLIRN